MNKILNIIAVLFILTPKAVLGANFNEEEKFVETFADEAISILSNDQVSKNEKNDQFTNLVMSAIDLNLISQFVLSKTWKSATDDQKERYLSAFKTYFINSYANKLDQYSGEKIIVNGSEEAGKYVIVDTNIVREGTDTLKINLKWRLLNKNGDIRIIDLNIEGISLVIAQREEFQSFLANNDGNLETLIEKIVSVSE
jgi:phospholipid transport system substrate-binding protein|tara:strand:- start:138 stop:731 length:594 start_codon:yes stop_codon:yes gene_type:complete